MTRLVFVPGMFSSSHAWDNFITYFSKKGFDCTVVQLKKNIELKNASLVDYINITKKQVTPDDIVIGHSMGGLIVQKIAEEIPIKAAVAIAPSPPKGIKAQTASLRYFILILRSIRYLPKIILKKPFIPTFSYLRMILLNNMDIQTAKNHYQELEKQSAIIVYELITSKYDVAIENIQSPFLFIGRKKDRLVPCHVVKNIANKQNASYVLVDGSHFLLNKWEDLAKAIHKFVKPYA